MDFEEYLREVAERQRRHPEWRAGQTYFNVLYEVAPYLADQLRGTTLDPYHRDSMIPLFLDELRVRWPNWVAEVRWDL
jgi:hypothetical protein